MFMDHPEIAPLRADRFFQTCFVYAIRLGARRMVQEMAMDHAGPKERKAAEKWLRQLEGELAVLHEGVEHRVLQMALIIHTIHSQGLYRLRNQTFDQYLRKQCKWVRSRQRAYQLLDYGRTVHELTTRVDTLPTEAQVRKQLAKLPLPERLSAWKEALSTSKSPGHVTNADLQKVVARYREPRINHSNGVAAEKSKIMKTLNCWAEQGRDADLRDVANQCAGLLERPC